MTIASSRPVACRISTTLSCFATILLVFGNQCCWSFESSLFQIAKSNLATSTKQASGINSLTHVSEDAWKSNSRRTTRLNVAQRTRGFDDDEAKKKKKCRPCDNPYDRTDDEESQLLDRREATFAMMGTLWATTGLIPTSAIFPNAANAVTGDEANMAFPNPIEGITNRATKECLVESLGNRECLLYASDGPKIWEGIDNKVLLERVEKASSALATIPELIESKKWIKVTGVMTGPMGDLIKTMGQLADISEHSNAAKLKIKAVKTDLYAIQAACDRKDGAAALKSHTAATNDLVAFIKTL